jgi:hypothetical protein
VCLEVIGLLLEHGADPNVRDRSCDATPAGWAEHHNLREAQEYPSRPRAVTVASS